MVQDNLEKGVSQFGDEEISHLVLRNTVIYRNLG